MLFSSNIANILLVLGLSAVVGSGLVVAFRIVRIDVPLMISASIAVIMLGLDGSLGRIDGGLFVIALLAYLFRTVSSARSNVDGESHHHIAKDYEEGLATEISGTHPLWQNSRLVVVASPCSLLAHSCSSLLRQTLQRHSGQVSSSSVLPWSLLEHRYPKSQPQSFPAKGQRDLCRKRSGLKLVQSSCSAGFPSLIAPIGVKHRSRLRPSVHACRCSCMSTHIRKRVCHQTLGGVLFTGYYVGYLVWTGLDAASASIHDEFNFSCSLYRSPQLLSP